MEAYLLQKNIVETCDKLVKEESIEVIPESDERVANVGPPSLYIIDVSTLHMSSIPLYTDYSSNSTC